MTWHLSTNTFRHPSDKAFRYYDVSVPRRIDAKQLPFPIFVFKGEIFDFDLIGNFRHYLSYHPDISYFSVSFKAF